VLSILLEILGGAGDGQQGGVCFFSQCFMFSLPLYLLSAVLSLEAITRFSHFTAVFLFDLRESM
jgi:hypothetical protein